jgi:predicted 3-demethylubiquinone-9 3-methyltransferase (glyoxalase superfamily)
MQKITPFLWFNGMAEEAMKFYTSVFKKSNRVMEAMLRMDKIEIQTLRDAWEGRE